MHNKNIKFLYLSEKDMISSGVSNMNKCITSMEDMFILLQKGDYRMGGENANEHGIRVSFPNHSDIEGMPIHKPDYRFMAMPAYLGGRFKIFGIKSYGSNPNNPQKGYPRSILMMSLMDATTGVPLAYMSANILSAMRTGATVGVGVKHLSVKHPNIFGIIGPGNVSKYALDAVMETQPSVEVIKIKGRSKKGIESFISYCKKKYPTIKKFIVCHNVEEVCNRADILLFGTTNAIKYEDNPSIKKEWLKPGALVISVSALLVDNEILSDERIKLIADNYAMYEEWGKNQPFPTQKNVSTLLGMGYYDAVTRKQISKDTIIDIGEILVRKTIGRDNEDQIIFYAVGGMPTEDVAWGHDVYINALEKGVGIRLDIW